MSHTAGIITLVKHEHDFINQWVEYHIHLGFSHFYILVDNIGYKQPDYVIDEKFKNKVSLIYTDDDDVKQYLNEVESSWHKSGILHELINHKITYKNLINEDWVTAVGVDQFIYMHGDTIQDYLLNIDESCDQIIVPWTFCIYNNYNCDFSNFLENINSYNYEYGVHLGHSNGMIRTNNLKRLHYNSHSFISKTEKQNIYIINEYFMFNSELDTFKVFDIAQKKIDSDSFDKIKINSFHIQLRNINESYIKGFFVWNNEQYTLNAMNELANNINNNITDYESIHRDIVPCEKNKIKNKTINIDPNLLELKIPKLECKNSSEHYNNLILEKLQTYNVNKELFENWKNNTFSF
jgi:hypothetical protein